MCMGAAAIGYFLYRAAQPCQVLTVWERVELLKNLDHASIHRYVSELLVSEVAEGCLALATDPRFDTASFDSMESALAARVDEGGHEVVSCMMDIADAARLDQDRNRNASVSFRDSMEPLCVIRHAKLMIKEGKWTADDARWLLVRGASVAQGQVRVEAMSFTKVYERPAIRVLGEAMQKMARITLGQ